VVIFCLLLPELCLDTAHSHNTKITTFFLALTPLITKFRERWGLVCQPYIFSFGRTLVGAKVIDLTRFHELSASKLASFIEKLGGLRTLHLS
jgi:hypothetical protein